MNLLGFDTATAACAVCVVRGDGEAFEETPAAERLADTPAHAAELMPAVARALARAELGFGDLDALAVGVGPGGFTGLRIGIATARGLAMALGVELRPVSSLAALASGIEGDAQLALIDARRGELFAALHSGGEVVLEPFAAAPGTVIERVRATGLTVLAAGDGSIRFRQALEAAGIEVAPAGARAHVISGLQVCRQAHEVEPVAAGALLPDYLREPDAKPR